MRATPAALAASITARCCPARSLKSLEEISTSVVDARQSRGKGFGLGIVEGADRHAQIGGLRIAGKGDDIGLRGAGFEGGDGEAAEVAGGSGDGDGHGVLLWLDAAEIRLYLRKGSTYIFVSITQVCTGGRP